MFAMGMCYQSVCGDPLELWNFSAYSLWSAAHLLALICSCRSLWILQKDRNTDWQAHRHYAMWTWWKHRLTSTQTLCYVDLMETQTDKHTDTMLCGLDVQSWAGTNSVNRSARTSRLRNTRTLCQIHVKFTDMLQLAMYVSAQLQPCVRQYWRCT